MAKFILSAFADEAGSALYEQISALKDNGICCIEPRSIDGRGILDFTNDELAHIKHELDKNGIKVGSLGSPIGKYGIDEDFDFCFELFKRALDACVILGTDYMRIFSFFTDRDSLASKRSEVIRRLDIMTREAEKYGITLCHENESRIYGQNPSEVSDLLTTLPRLGGIFDAANYVMEGQDVTEGITATLKNFKYMHIKDAILTTKEIVPAGEGDGKIAEIIDLINKSTDKEVYLTLEPHLHIFDAYKKIDMHELKGKYSFKSNREAFDFAASALKELLLKQGYKKDGNNQWTK